MGAVIPMRPFENALQQAAKLPPARTLSRGQCIRAVLRDLAEGRNGHAIAGQLQQARLRTPSHAPEGGAA